MMIVIKRKNVQNQWQQFCGYQACGRECEIMAVFAAGLQKGFF